MKSVFFRLLLVFTLAAAAYQPMEAQCPMCRMSAESNLKNGGTAGKGLNTGILYMLATPDLWVGVCGYMWYTNRRKEHDNE